jgi:hypothetical protein
VKLTIGRRVSLRTVGKAIGTSHVALVHWAAGSTQPTCDHLRSLEKFFRLEPGTLVVERLLNDYEETMEPEFIINRPSIGVVMRLLIKKPEDPNV